MQHLTDEERELLATDSELQAHRKSLRVARDEDALLERLELERQAKLDATIEGPLVALREAGRPWREWCSTWAMYKEQEGVFLASVQDLCERLLWLEESEGELRESTVLNTQRTEWESLLNWEKEKRKYVQKSGAWQEAFLLQYDERWSQERELAQKMKVSILFEPTEEDKDNAEIARLLERTKYLSTRK